jgi:hypothetical protein
MTTTSSSAPMLRLKAAVASFADGIQLSLTKHEVRDLPPADPAPGEE